MLLNTGIFILLNTGTGIFKINIKKVYKIGHLSCQPKKYCSIIPTFLTFANVKFSPNNSALFL